MLTENSRQALRGYVERRGPLADRPRSVALQPQDKMVPDWTWGDESLHLALPPIETHQMVVIATSENSL